MRFMLLQNYGPAESDCPPMPEWSPAEIRAHIEFQQALNRELLDRGELVDAQGLAGPEQARRVVSDGTGAPVITDGPFPEAKELPGRVPAGRRRDASGGPSRSPRRPPPRPARTGCRSGSPSRSVRC